MSEVPHEMNDNSNIECHLQQLGMGSLICVAADQFGVGHTNEVGPENCLNCDVGKIYRDIGCDAVLPKLRIYKFQGCQVVKLESLFCKIRKRVTSLNYCRSCPLVISETTRIIVSTATGLFEAQGFHSAYKDLEKARLAIRDGNFDSAVTRSISALESTMRISLEKLQSPLPNNKALTDLWKSTREIMKFDDLDPSQKTRNLVNTISGMMSHLGGLRNALGDAHGKGLFPPDVSESIAELAINIASTLATLVIRRLNQIEKSVSDE